MKTVILTKPGEFYLSETDPPAEPGPGEAVVQVRRIGICGTDMSAYKGTHAFIQYPRILGHELAVEIVAVGENDRGLKVGDYCAVLPYLYCGRCLPCRQGKSNCCLELKYLGVHIDGGMREYIRAPLPKLYKSGQVSLDQLALVEMLTIGAHAVNRSQIQPGETVLVIGAGPIGLSVVEFVQQGGANVLIMELNKQRLAFCQEQLGIDNCLDGAEDPTGQLKARLNGDLPTVVFDATGNAHSMRNAFNLVAHGGKLIYVGVVKEEICINDVDFHHRELTLMSSRNSVEQDYLQTIRLLETGKIDISAWITHRASLESMIEAFPGWVRPESGVMKALVEVS